jgi:predicted TIM-barrel fold metal-dependent hydrolase
MIVDVHHHYADGAHYPDYRDFPAQLIEAMDARGWAWTCLNGLGPAYRNKGNRDVAEAVGRFPDRILGVGYADLDRETPGAVDDLKRMGMRGLKVIGTLRRYDDDDYLPFYERAAAHGLPILFHTGFLGGNPLSRRQDVSSDRYRPMTLDRIARLFPELTLIAAHLGTMTWFHEAVAVMNHPNVYGDTSGGPSSTPPDFYRVPLNDRLNWDRMLFGTDSLPYDGHIPFGELTGLMNALKLPAETQRGVLGETAARLFGLAKPGKSET